VDLEVTGSGNDFQVQAALFDLPPSGPPRYVTSGFAARRGVGTGRVRVHIELEDVAYVLPAGHGLRLNLDNINLRGQPGHLHFYVIPEFKDVDLSVHLDPAFPARVELPLRSVGIELLPRQAQGSAAAGLDHRLRIDGHAPLAAAPYVVLIGGSGSGPGIPLPPHLPLNLDAWTELGLLGLNLPPFLSHAGILDGSGQGSARLLAPASVTAGLAGQRLSWAVLVLDTRNQWRSGGPAELRILP
jgi:hypothetical protein